MRGLRQHGGSGEYILCTETKPAIQNNVEFNGFKNPFLAVTTNYLQA